MTKTREPYIVPGTFEHHDGLSPTPDHLGAGGIGPGVFDGGDELLAYQAQGLLLSLLAERDEARQWARHLLRRSMAYRAMAAYWREQYQDQRRRRMHTPL